MSYDENRISDLIDGGLHHKAQLEKELLLLRHERSKNGWNQKEADRHEELCKLLKL